MYHDEDLALALKLQEQFDREVLSENPNSFFSPDNKQNKENRNRSIHENGSLIDPSWEYVDPTPDIHVLFMQFDKRFFWNKLKHVEVRWSPRMTSCAGICCYEGRGGLCSVRLSLPLLKLRPRKDLVETLLHEMIHAYLFVTDNDRDRDGHGPEFHKHMHRINKEAGTNITVYHTFHEEVELYKQHWWRCDGPCQNRPPFFGMVKRSMNRAPGPSDFWYEGHQRSCGGNFIKVREPEDFGKKGAKKNISSKDQSSRQSKGKDIRNFFPINGIGNSSNTTKTANSFKGVSPPKPFKRTGMAGKSNTSTAKGWVAWPPKGRVAWPPKNNGGNSSTTGGRGTSKGYVVWPPKNNGGNSSTTGGRGTSKGYVVWPPKNNGGNSSTTGGRGTSKGYVVWPPKNNGGNSSTTGGRGFTGGMLMNKGGGTLTVTAKGNKNRQKEQSIPANKTGESTLANVRTITDVQQESTAAVPNSSGLPNVRTINGPISKMPSRNFVPFGGSGHTLGTAEANKENPNRMLGRQNMMQNVTFPGRSSSVASSWPNKRVAVMDSNTMDCSESKRSAFVTDPNGKVFEIKDDISEAFPTVNCPVCNLQLKEYQLNMHLDTCLSSCVESASSVDVVCIEDSPEKQECMGDNVKCPVCNLKTNKEDINIHLENCIGNVFEEEGIGIRDQDSDDEIEFTDLTQTDDQKFPCPSCSGLFKEKEMNNHLDHCLSSAF